MKKFDVSIELNTRGRISSESVARIVEAEKHKLIGGDDRYIADGVIYEEDYRFNSDEKIREATEEEIKLYEALRTVERHFRGL